MLLEGLSCLAEPLGWDQRCGGGCIGPVRIAARQAGRKHVLQASLAIAVPSLPRSPPKKAFLHVLGPLGHLCRQQVGPGEKSAGREEGAALGARRCSSFRRVL